MRILFFSFFMLLFSGNLGAQPACAGHFPNKTPYVFSRATLQQKAQLLCFQEFAVMWSGLTRTPLWSAEYLTPLRISKAKLIPRQGEFHEEMRVDGAKLLDYKYSGFDRGHLAPSADMSSVASQQESFNLVNIVPQNPKQNSAQWAGVEMTVRGLASKDSYYVVTGVVFEGAQIPFLKGRVAVPTSLYKLVYHPRSNQAAAYWVDNKADASIQIMQLSTLETRTGVSFGLPNPTPLFLVHPSSLRRKS